jgi:hypothetical protein
VKRRLLVLVAAGLLAAQAASAHAAATGPLSVHVEGAVAAPSFQQPPLTVWPFRAVETMHGIIDFANESDGTIVAFDEGDPDQPIVTGSVYGAQLPVGAVAFACVTTEFGARGEPLGGACAVAGAIVGRGTFQISELALAAGGRIAWDVSFPNVFCRDCRQR